MICTSSLVSREVTKEKEATHTDAKPDGYTATKLVRANSIGHDNNTTVMLKLMAEK